MKLVFLCVDALMLSNVPYYIALLQNYVAHPYAGSGGAGQLGLNDANVRVYSDAQRVLQQLTQKRPLCYEEWDQLHQRCMKNAYQPTRPLSFLMQAKPAWVPELSCPSLYTKVSLDPDAVRREAALLAAQPQGSDLVRPNLIQTPQFAPCEALSGRPAVMRARKTVAEAWKRIARVVQLQIVTQFPECAEAFIHSIAHRQHDCTPVEQPKAPKPPRLPCGRRTRFLTVPTQVPLFLSLFFVASVALHALMRKD
jgi:hypothetical protein